MRHNSSSCRLAVAVAVAAVALGPPVPTCWPGPRTLFCPTSTLTTVWSCRSPRSKSTSPLTHCCLKTWMLTFSERREMAKRLANLSSTCKLLSNRNIDVVKIKATIKGLRLELEGSQFSCHQEAASAVALDCQVLTCWPEPTTTFCLSSTLTKARCQLIPPFLQNGRATLLEQPVMAKRLTNLVFNL